MNKHQQALQKIRDEFHRFSLDETPRLAHHWSLIPQEMDDLLSHALLYLCRSMNVDRAAVFLLDDHTQVLVARQLIDGDKVMHETLLSIRRAGADIILTYSAKDCARYLRKLRG